MDNSVVIMGGGKLGGGGKGLKGKMVMEKTRFKKWETENNQD